MFWGLSVPLRKSLLSPPLASKLLLHRYPDEGTKEPFRKEEEGNRERERPLWTFCFQPILIAYPALTHIIWFSFSVLPGGAAGKSKFPFLFCPLWKGEMNLVLSFKARNNSEILAPSLRLPQYWASTAPSQLSLSPACAPCPLGPEPLSRSTLLCCD